MNFLNFLNPDMILHTGDIVKFGSKKKEWARFSRIFNKFIEHTPPIFFPVIGNHDLSMISKSGLENYFKTFKYLENNRWYCVYVNEKILILNLDSNFNKLDKVLVTAQNIFIRKILEQYKGKYKLLLINFHHPIYRNLKTLKLRKEYIKNFQELFNEISAAITYINGHFHNFFYHKINSRAHIIITGGAGAPLHKFVSGLLNKHHIVILKCNLMKSRVRVSLLVFKSPQRFHLKTIDEYSF
ncbi:MAG: metallophosphoesterase family protein [Planctomycetota bacterium]